MTRDFAPVFASGRCAVCAATRETVVDLEAHIAPHLADGSCCVQLDFRKTPPVEQVVPTESLPVTGDWGGLWDGTGSADAEFKDTNSMAQRKALNELAATRRRIARAAKEFK